MIIAILLLFLFLYSDNIIKQISIIKISSSW